MPTQMMKSAEAFIHPRDEKGAQLRSRAASRTGSGLWSGSSKSGSLVSHMYGYCCTVVVAAMGAVVVVFSFDVPIETSEGALLNLEPAYTRDPLVNVGSYYPLLSIPAAYSKIV